MFHLLLSRNLFARIRQFRLVRQHQAIRGDSYASGKSADFFESEVCAIDGSFFDAGKDGQFDFGFLRKLHFRDVPQFSHLDNRLPEAPDVESRVVARSHSSQSCSFFTNVLRCFQSPVFQSERTAMRSVRAQSICQHSSVLSWNRTRMNSLPSAKLCSANSTTLPLTP